MKDFRTLLVWQKAHALVLVVYQATSTFPKNELYGITSQIRRAAVSIATNIAEGCGRDSDAELCRFFKIAMGSSSETEYLLQLTYELGYLTEEQYKRIQPNLTEVRKMLNAFIQKLKVDRLRS